MIRSMTLFASLMMAVVAIIASGCCGPAGCGIGCANYSCSDCDGGFRQPVCGGPIAAARNLRRNAICGSGCGEAYIGEWTSTPPDCNDPCCGSQFVGGAVKARPFCRTQPLCLGCGGLLRALYGKRTCSGDESSQPCPGDCGGLCGSCSSSGEYVGSDYVADDYTEIGSEVVVPGPVSGGCGCATCRGPESPMATRLAAMGRHPTGDSIAARARRTNERAQQIRRR